MPQKVSVLIPTKDNERDLMDCLESIGHLDYPKEMIEIIIWDNNSRVESKGTLKTYLTEFSTKYQSNPILIKNDTNYGVYTSRDELLKLIKNSTQFILSIDDDVILPPNLLKELLQSFEKTQKTGIIGPKIVYDVAPSELSHGAGFINWWLGTYSTLDMHRTTECDYVIGCCMLINRAVIDAIGGFDRDYYTSHGEVDFCVRAKQQGFKVLYTPDVVVKHRVDRGGTKNPERLYYIFRNKLLFIKKNAPIPQKWFSLTFYMFFWIPKTLLSLMIQPRRFSAKEVSMIFKGMFHGWMNKKGKVIP